MTAQRFSVRVRTELKPMLPFELPETQTLHATTDVWCVVVTTGGRESAQLEAEATARYITRSMQARVIEVEVNELPMEDAA